MRAVLLIFAGLGLLGAALLAWMVLQVGERQASFDGVVAAARAGSDPQEFQIARRYRNEIDSEMGRVKLHMVELEPAAGGHAVEKQVAFSVWMDLRDGASVDGLLLEDGAWLFPALDAEDFGLARLLFGSGGLILALLAALAAFAALRPRSA
ncbi:MAG TPA: hypothetical protein VGC54_12790 [Planctomycetota bacterium]